MSSSKGKRSGADHDQGFYYVQIRAPRVLPSSGFTSRVDIAMRGKIRVMKVEVETLKVLAEGGGDEVMA